MLSRGGSDCCGLRGDSGGRGAELVIGSGEYTSNEPDTEGMKRCSRMNIIIKNYLEI